MNTSEKLHYRVNTFRAAGLEARWTRTRGGAPIIAAREPGGTWYVIDLHAWKRLQKFGVLEGFRQCTALGEFFSIPA